MLRLEDVVEVRVGMEPRENFVDIHANGRWYATTLSYVSLLGRKGKLGALGKLSPTPEDDTSGLLEEGYYVSYGSLEHMLVVETML